MRTLACLALAHVSLGEAPPKLNLVLQPLMAGLRRENDPDLQREYGTGLCLFLGQQRAAATREAGKTAPNAKVLGNVMKMAAGGNSYRATWELLISDASATADLLERVRRCLDAGSKSGEAGTKLAEEDDEVARAGLEGNVEAVVAAAGQLPATQDGSDPSAVSRRGGELALQQGAVLYGRAIFEVLPELRGLLLAPLSAAVPDATRLHDGSFQVAAVPDPGPLLDSLHVLRSVVSHVDCHVAEQHVAGRLHQLGMLLRVNDLGVQLAAADVMAATAAALPPLHLPAAVQAAVRLLRLAASDAARLGGMLAIAHLLTRLGVRIVPVLFLALLPVMAAMGDPNGEVRALASSSFAHVLTLLPLAQSVVFTQVPGLSEEQM